jgi:HPt (histidine-containing phosphotransfer) domain-containing protein
MSDEFLKVARHEIQTELDSLASIFQSCTNDEQFQIRSKEIENHMHKIKGLAPMMGQTKVGEIARTSDVILKYVIANGLLKDSHKMVLEAVQRMNRIFKGDTKTEDDFKAQAKNLFPQISGL